MAESDAKAQLEEGVSTRTQKLPISARPSPLLGPAGRKGDQNVT